MSPSTAITPETAVERRQAAAFVAELIIYRRHIRSYPASHPIVTASLQKTITNFAPLIADSRAFTLGISQEGLLFKNDILGSGIAKFVEFAATLASFGIITISFTAELKPEELHLFNCITCRPRNEVWESGGIKHALAADGIQAIKVQVIDPSVFTLTDGLIPESAGGAADPWEIFVRKLLDGYFSASPERLLQLIAAPPAELGKEFGSIIDGIPEEEHHQTIKTMADFFAGLASRQASEGLHEDALEKITAFIAGIPPRLRRDFILNICNSSHTITGFSEELLQRIPGDAFLEAMQSVATHGENIPEMVLKLMHRLSAQSESTLDLDAAINNGGSAEKVRLLLKESAIEQFVPPAYRKTLMSILATDTLPIKSMGALADLQKTLGYHHLEAKTGDIICEIIRQIPAAERGDGIRTNLMALASHYLCNGDFHSLERVCRIILDEAYAKQCTAFFDPGFVQDILDAASLLGREKYLDIRSIISTVGQPFVVPLMERLFAEENRSLRRFWFDCLGDLGEMVRNAALERLNDERWFVVRNLIIMLDGFGDQEVQRQVRRLVGHSHPKVRKQALKYLLHYQDPMVDNQLLQDLESNDPARRLAAVQIAEMSGNPDVLQKLLAILDSGSITDYGLEIKSAVIQALAGIGNAQAVPKLKEILYSGKFLHSGRHTQLKIVIIRSLPRFPAALVRPLLEEICANGGKSLSPVAAEALKGLQGAVP